MRHCLVVAHRTLDSPLLADAILEEASRGPCTFHLVVPLMDAGDGLTWTEGEVRRTARDHLDEALERFTAHGFAIIGEVGSSTSPVDSLNDVLRRHETGFYDMVIVSTLPHAFSRWLHVDTPSRIGRTTGLPVRHVETPSKVEL